MTEKTSDIDPAHDTARLVVAQMARSLSVAVATAAATVVVIAWIASLEDVQQVSLAHYLFWPLAVAAVTLQFTAYRLGQPTATSGTSG